VKVLSYNLFWWSLYKDRHGNGKSASKLIAKSMDPPIDLMGFQECKDLRWVLGDALLLDKYMAIQGSHSKCMAFRKQGWSLLAHGDVDVAEDTYWNWYGKRGVQWMRVRHWESEKKVLFLNFHGALSINSGGTCGGWVTAQNLLRVVTERGQKGDTVIVVGDFNANSASTMLQELRRKLLHVFNGEVFGGIDNVFSNLGQEAIVSTERLGKGGSDHDALAVVFKVGSSEGGPAPGVKGALTALNKAVKSLGHSSTCDCDCSWNRTKGACQHFDDGCCAMCCCGSYKFSNTKTAKGAMCSKAPIDWNVFWCGLSENGAQYTFGPGGWESNQDNINPDWCCKRCQEAPQCKAWTWSAYPASPRNRSVTGHCLLKGSAPVSKRWADGSASGRAAGPAAELAAKGKVREVV